MEDLAHLYLIESTNSIIIRMSFSVSNNHYYYYRYCGCPVRACVCDAHTHTQQHSTIRQTDSFRESGPVLIELIDKRNLFSRWLRSGRNSDRQRYVAQRRTVARAVKRAKRSGCKRRQS